MNHQCIRQHLKQQAYRIATSGASRAIPVIIRDLRQMQAGTARLVGPEHHNGTRPQAPERNHQTPDRREASIEVGQAMTLGLVWPTCTFNHPREGGGSLQKANQTPEEKQTRSLSATRGGGHFRSSQSQSHTPKGGRPVLDTGKRTTTANKNGKRFGARSLLWSFADRPFREGGLIQKPVSLIFFKTNSHHPPGGGRPKTKGLHGYPLNH